MQSQDRIAQRHQERLLAREIFAAEDGVAQSLLQPLAGIEEVRLERLEIEFFEQILLVAIAEGSKQVGVMIEMVFDRRLVPPRDEQHLLDAVRNQLFDHILHDRLARNRQHLFRL